MSVLQLCRKLLRAREGATAIEYGLIAALISVALIVSVGSFGNELNAVFTGVDDTLTKALD